MAAQAKRDTDMTSGSIVKHLLMFALPLLVGNVFQQMYNTVDSIVVGKFVGKEALAAVGSVGPIINTLIGIFGGFAVGAGVLISQYYGAHDEQSVHDCVQTAILLTLVLSVVLTAVGVFCTPLFVKMMQTPDDVIPDASEYLRIYFSGLAGLLIYNIGSGILRAVGDSRRPLYFLIVSAVTNTVLDIVFVAVFRMGIAGVAIATILAQFISAILVLIVLTRTDGSYRVCWTKLRFHPVMLRRILLIGTPTAIQSGVTSFSNVFVQSYINRFGSACMAGWTAYSKIDAFAMLPITSIAMSATTFVGQNIGACDRVRAKQGTSCAIRLSLIITALILIPLMVFAEQLVGLFNTEPDVLSFGIRFIRQISPFYLLCVFNQVYGGALRGAGDTKAPMFIMLLSFVAFRQVYLFTVYSLTHSITWVAMGYPAGWILCSVILFLYYRSGRWQKYSEHIVARRKPE